MVIFYNSPIFYLWQVMALTLVWAAVSAMSVDMSSQQGFLGNVHGNQCIFNLWMLVVSHWRTEFLGCYWDGNSPICNGTCREGWTKKAADRCGDGKCCLTGMKAYCCPTIETPEDCYWDGTSPFCAGGCKVIGEKVYMEDICGDGKCCATGNKVLCCRKPS